MEITLDPIVSRRKAPFYLVHKTILGNEHLYIKAGWNLSVPNCWSIHSGSCLLTTDATVANRTGKIKSVVEGLEVDNMVMEVCAASGTKGVALVQPNLYATVTRKYSTGVSLSPDSYLICGNDYLDCMVTNGVAGDTFEILLLMWFKNWSYGMMLPRPQKDCK